MEQKQVIPRLCVICDQPLKGRSDKRFCNIKCKNYYHLEVQRSMKIITDDFFSSSTIRRKDGSIQIGHQFFD